MSNILKASIVRNRSAISRSGETKGNVIRLNLNHADALSTSAASYRYFGIALNPANAINIIKGDHIQVSTITTANIAIFGSVVHAMGGLNTSLMIGMYWIGLKRKFSNPEPSEARMNRQKSATTTGDNIIGRSSKVVTIPLPMKWRFKRRAKPNPIRN